MRAPPNEALLPTAHFGMRQAGAALAHVARPAAFYWRRCSRALGVMRIERVVGWPVGD